MEAAAVPSHTRLPPIPASRKMKPRAPVPPLMRSQSETGPPNLDPPDHGGGDGLSVENVELNVILPGGEHHMARVDGSKPVMDLLIVLCGRYRLSPAGHTLELLSRDNASPLQYKPNTPLGALCAGTALLKPRPASEDRLKKPMQPVVPEQTVRLMVNYLRTQKTMVRVSPRVALQALLPEICNKCEFNVPLTTLFRDASETELLDMSCSLSELGIKEVYAVDRSKELSHGLNDNTDLPEKENKGLLSFLRPKKKKSDDDVSECGSNSSMHGDSSRDTSMPGTPLMGQQQHHQRPMSMPCVPSPMLGTLPGGGGGGGGGSKGPYGVSVCPEGPRKRRAPAPPVSPTNPLATTPIPEDGEPNKDKENVPSISPGSQDSGFEQVCRDHLQSSPDQLCLAQETRRSQSPPAPLASSSTEAAGATSPLAMLQHRTKRRAPPPPPSTTAQGMQVAAESPPSPPPRSAPEQASAALFQPGSPPPVQPSVENQHRRRSSSTASTQSSGSLPLKDENKEGVSERPTPVKPPRGSQASPPPVVPTSPPPGIARDPPQFQAPPPPPYPPPPPEPTAPPPAPPHAVPSEKTLNEGGGMGSDSNVTKQQCMPEAAPRRLEQGTTAKSETQKTFCGASQQAHALADNMVQEYSSDLVQANTDAAATAEFDELIAELEMGLTDDDLRSKSSHPNVETVKNIQAEADVNFIVEPVKKPEPALPDSTVIKATADSSSNNTDKVDINNETKYPVLSANANVATDVKRGPSKKALQFLKAYNDMQKREAADKNKAGNVQQVSDKPPVTQKKDGNEVKVDFLAKVQKSALAQQRDHKSKPTLCGSFSGATAKASGCVVGEQDPRHKRLSMAFPDISTKPNSELSRAERHGGSLKCLDKMPVKNETFLNAHVEKIPVVHAKSVDKQVKSIPAERQNASSEQYKKQLVTQKYMTYVEESVMIQPVEIHKEIAGAREEIVEPNKVFKVIAEERLTKPSEKTIISESIKSEKVSEINKTSQPVMDQSNEPEASMQNSIFYKTRSISREPCVPEVEYQYNSAEPSSPVLPVYKQPSDRWRSTNEITRDYLPKVGLTTYRIVPSKPVIRPKPETADVPFLLPTYETEASKTETATATDTTKEIKEKLKYDSTAKIRDITANPQQHTAHQSPVISPPLIPPPLIPPPLIPPLSGLSNVTRPFQRSHSLQCTPETISQQHSAVKATEPLASIATSPPSSSKQDAFFRPGRRTSSLYVASAIAKKTAYKSIDTPNETYSGTTTTKTTPVDALPPLQVNCEQDELIIPPPPQFSTEENANIPNAPGDPGKVIIIEAPRVHQWKPKLFRPVSFPSVIFKDDKPSSMSVESSHLESKNTVFAVKSPPPVISQTSSGYPFNVKSASNSSQIQSVLSSPKSTDASPFYQPPTVLNTTGTALESPSLIYEQRKPSGEDTGLFGPMLKLKPVVQKPILKDNNPHNSLMEALQSTDNMGRLRKVSGENLQKIPAAVESETERDALMAAIRSGAGGKRLRKTSSTAAEELVSQQLREADSSDSATVRTRLASVHSPPVPTAPPPVILMGNGARSTECSPEEARLAMLDAIRSGSCAGMLKKVPKSVKTIEVNGKSGTIRSSSS
ncbi:protein cordon-bleu-like isoform X3 [Lethenteron reissneri]|uniref:protein cordon-bleu-like isoform X3 n=1 Tax=Lethenteron reissneri TaxID=7753 RepID=UPI002AB67683|nr:protein cordon-bleu-like isoform X3 [Lethenteron reissneri]